MKEAGSNRDDQSHLPASACSRLGTQNQTNSDPALSQADGHVSQPNELSSNANRRGCRTWLSINLKS
jgi:hypothetical protein